MSNKKEEKDIKYYLNMVRSHLPLLIAPLFVLGFLSLCLSFMLPKVYEAHTTILIQQPRALEDSMGKIAASPSIKEWLNTMREEILSWPNLANIASEIGLLKKEQKEGNLLLETKQAEAVVKNLRENIKITISRGTLIQILYQNKDPYLAQKIAQTITDRYIEKKLKEQREQTFGAVSFLEQQLAFYQKKLEESEEALQQFKNRHLLELPGTEQSNLTKLGQAQADLRMVNLDLIEAKKLKESLEKQLSGEEKMVITETVKKANPVIAQLNARLRDLELELTNARATCTEKHPMVIKIRKAIEKTKQQLAQEEKELMDSETITANPIYEQLEQNLNNVKARIESLNARKKDLIEMSNRLEKMVENVPELEKELSKLNRELETNNNMYELFKSKLETARISREIEAERQGVKFEIIEPARIPIKPSKPNKLKAILLGLLTGGMLGVGLVYLAEYTDHSFRTFEDASNFLDKPVLGAIPEIVTEKKKKKKNKIQSFLALLVDFFSLVKDKFKNILR